MDVLQALKAAVKKVQVANLDGIFVMVVQIRITHFISYFKSSGWSG